MSAKRLRKRIILTVLVLLLAAGAYFGYQNRESIEQIPIGSGVKAKTLATSLFLQGRDETAIQAEDIGYHPLFKYFKAKIDRENKAVSVSFLIPGLFKKKAIYLDKIGAVLLNGVKEDDVRAWKPDMPAAEPSDAAAKPWPEGDLLPNTPDLTGIDSAMLAAALDNVFAEPDPAKLKRTRAVVVVKDGRLIAERYAPGFDKDTPLLGWSMSKSVTSALVGILVGRGKLDIRAPAPVPEWAGQSDPRRSITLDQLLRMSSGLEWYEEYADHPISDVNRMLFLKGDMAAFAASKPLKTAPGTVFEYSSGTALIISRIIRASIGNQTDYLAFPRRALFNRIGMRTAVMEPDASGTFVGSSFTYASARDWARFGLLYLNDGVWAGERILPEGWVAYTRTPAPAAKKGEYGVQFWLNRGPEGSPEKRDYPRLPEDAFFCDGYQGQFVAVVPSAGLVVVRLGMTWQGDWGTEDLIGGVLAAVRKEKP
ncbi:MAG: serine hydrolase [Acidobacteriota bacterium]|nr:serine hydrolase [Acidobacteriota bacterium]